MTGRTLFHYRIESKLGEGGMGVVYKARDTRLDRFVAIKMLPPDKTTEPERKRRFVQEAKAASALNHPNILHVYDIETGGEVDFIVMEYFEGQTLADLIGRKGLPVRDTLKYAVQVADGLAAAHAAGIVHRDIKPGNIMVNDKGLVKILDFGLAKLTDSAEGGEFRSTQTIKPATEEGTIVGTVAYMSPEQAEGKKVDSRSDVFSFGSVLYEMATGARAFQGQTKISTLSAILHQEPKPPDEVTPSVPRELGRVISHCLRKDPHRRFQHMDDVKTLLEELKEESESGRLASRAVARAVPRGRRWPLAVASAAAILALAAAATLWLLRNERGGSAPSEAPVMRLTSDTGLTTDPALSPDGKLVAYASDRAGGENLDIWVQQIDGGAPLRLTSDANDDYEPSFSPDGSRIVFRSERDGGAIYTIPSLGGEARLIAKGGRHARFSPDGTRIAFVTGVGGLGGVSGGELLIIPSVGGTPRKLVPGDVGAANPVWSPDGKWIVFACGTYRIDDWAIVPSDLTEPVTRQENASGSRTGPGRAVMILKLDALKKSGLGELKPSQWLAGNRLLFSAKSGDTSHVFEIGLSPPGVMAKQWHLDSSPRRLTFSTGFDQGASVATGGSGSSAGRIAFASLVRKEDIWSVALDADHPRLGGKLQQLTEENGFHIFPSVSRDGKKIAYVAHAAYNDEVWLLDLNVAKKSQFSTAVSAKYKLQITPDGSQVFYGDVVSRTDYGVNAVSVAGGAPARICEKCDGWIWDWLPERRRLLTFGQGKTTVVATMHNLETGKSTLFLERPPMNLYEFRWSPDSRWLTFLTRGGPAGQSTVYVAPFTADQSPREDSWIPITDGSVSEDKLNWSPDGNTIYSVSDRDGFPCIWAYPLDPQIKRPAGAPLPIFHSHGARLSIRNANVVSQGLSVARDKIVFNMGEITGNIWMTELSQNRK